MRSAVRIFAGIRPSTGSDDLPPGIPFDTMSPRAASMRPANALVANDVRLTAGELRPLLDKGTALVTLSGAPQVNTIYRYGQSIVSDTLYWFQFTGDVDVVKGPISGDTEEKTYWTDGTYPKKTKSNLATTGTPYPSSSLRMGIPAPAAAPTVTVTGSATNPSDPGEAVTMVYTYVSSWGEEGPPSPASAVVTWRAGQTLAVSAMSTAPSGAYDIASKRLYRSATGTSATQFQFNSTAGDIPVATTTYSDTVLTANLADVLATSGWLPPPDNMIGLITTNGGVMAGFFGSTLCFSEPFVPSAWPPRYQQATNSPIVAIAAFDSTVVAFCTQGIQLFTFTDPSAISQIPVPAVQTAVSKRSVVQMDGAVIFAAADGLWKISSSGLECLTAGAYQKADWQALAPTTFSCYESDGRYVVFFGAANGGLVFDFSGGLAISTHDIPAYGGYRDRSKDTLYVVDAGNTVKKFEGGSALTYTWQSGVFHYESALNMAIGRVDASAYPVTFKVYVDGSLKFTQTVTSNEMFRLPSGYMSQRYSMSISGTAVIRELAMATSAAEMTAE